MLLLAALLAVPQVAPAQRPVLTPIPAPAEVGRAIPLDTGGVAGSDGAEIWYGKPGERSVRDVSRATLLPVLPARGMATGAAIVIAPGGAFLSVSWEHEGVETARWLADHGIAAFVLTYRTEPTPRDPAAFGAAFGMRMQGLVLAPGERRKVPTPPYIVQDGAAALALVRARAAQWGVDPARVGMMGFSAGAVATIAVTLSATPGTMPAFIAPIYGGMNAVTVPDAAPPMFAALAADDPLIGRAGFGAAEAWAAARKPVELHVFERGSHGFGTGRAGTTSANWLDLFRRWLDTSGLLKARP